MNIKNEFMNKCIKKFYKKEEQKFINHYPLNNLPIDIIKLVFEYHNHINNIKCYIEYYKGLIVKTNLNLHENKILNVMNYDYIRNYI